MTEERRSAPRHQLAEPLPATLNGVAVRVIDISTIGARVEHEERIGSGTSMLRVRWEGRDLAIAIRIVRSVIAGRRDSTLVYHSGLQFTATDSDAAAAVGDIILRNAEALSVSATAAAPVEQAATSAAPQAAEPDFDTTWRRRLFFADDDHEDDKPFAQFRLTPSGWVKSYVDTPAQPDDGFTIPRDDPDFPELQKTFEFADPDTRHMMRIALAAKLGSSGT